MIRTGLFRSTSSVFQKAHSTLARSFLIGNVGQRKMTAIRSILAVLLLGLVGCARPSAPPITVVVRVVDQSGSPVNAAVLTWSELSRDDMLGIPFTASGLKERRRLSSTSLIDGIAVLQFQEEMLKLLSVEISDENLKVEKVVSNRRDGTLYVHPTEDGLLVTWGSMTGLPDPLRQDFTITVVRKQNKKGPNRVAGGN